MKKSNFSPVFLSIALAIGSVIFFTNCITTASSSNVITLRISQNNEVVVFDNNTNKLYVLQTENELDPIFVTLSDAQLQFDERHLLIANEETAYYLGLDNGNGFLNNIEVPENQHFQGYGLGLFNNIDGSVINALDNTNSIYTAINNDEKDKLCDAGDDYCQAGGVGSSSCSVSNDGGESCSTTCNSGYYACCNDIRPLCKCCKMTSNQ